jgi:hypothetical protein
LFGIGSTVTAVIVSALSVMVTVMYDGAPP